MAEFTERELLTLTAAQIFNSVAKSGLFPNTPESEVKRQAEFAVRVARELMDAAARSLSR